MKPRRSNASAEKIYSRPVASTVARGAWPPPPPPKGLNSIDFYVMLLLELAGSLGPPTAPSPFCVLATVLDSI